MRALLMFLLTATAALAEGERAGEFDYYVLSLSWSPSWCALEGDARGSPQCDPSGNFGWVLHGLWPQYHRGFPSNCPTAQRPPSRAMTQDMADIMGTSGLAWYQWKKHGSCTGLTATAYYALARRAYARITRPAVFRKLSKPIKLPASVVEEAFLKANPGLERDMLTITCKQGRIQEARVCLSKTLNPVPCGRDVVQDCRMKDALFEPVR
ncbi:ribonuclease I [Roseovarius litorisediminis]|uniref:Ribonuclease I n=1 Tax=Roseovarius litorisediminis TaxID=1312363 RepID=A0A1Y5S0E8_9RHOB|nr:ribonuclease T2 [Roseovarius litorisediminis]SLN29866.1 ribonuclease I [Roseovarius litorisediminis]